MFDSKFHTNQQIYLAIGLLFIFFSTSLFFYKDKKTTPILLLLVGTFFIGLFAITLDPFLNTWDEQYHALVAKNLSQTPLHPRLYPDPALPYSFVHWTLNYTWVHKQPWFMWQMALFIKFFGASEISIRFASLICFVFSTLCVYRIGKNLCNPTIGFLAAVLWSSNFFFYALMSGGHSTDQNDIVFGCYTCFSIWAFTEYIVADKKTKWIILIGVFAGISVLTKWLSGLIVFSAYGLYTILEAWPNIHRIKIYKNILLSFIISLLIAGSWQLYIFTRFPEEAAFEFSLISKHFKEVVEGHGGTNWFYFENFSVMYGKSSLLFFGLGMYFLYKYCSNKKLFFSVFGLVAITYIFFTLAKTKMIGFPIICSSIIMGCFASVLFAVVSKLEKIKFGKQIAIGLIVTVSIFFLRIEEIQFQHSVWEKNGIISSYRANKLFWTQVYKDLPPAPPKTALFNCPNDCYIEAMFYSDFISGYCGIPLVNQMEIIKQKGYQTYVLDDGNLTKELQNDKNFTVIRGKQFNIIKSDTVTIQNDEKMFLEIESGAKLLFRLGTTPKQYIIDYFEDETCRIKLITGEYLSFNILGEGGVFVNNNIFTIANRFKISFSNNIITLKTLFDVPIKLNNNVMVYGNKKEYRDLKLIINSKLI